MLDSPYNDEDLVYADPEKRVIVGKVEFGKNGNAKPLQMPEVIRPPKEGDERRRGKPRKRFYPWEPIKRCASSTRSTGSGGSRPANYAGFGDGEIGEGTVLELETTIV